MGFVLTPFMRYCAECGKKLLEPDEKFCPECGAALSKEIPPAIGAKQPSAAALSAKVGKEKPAAGEPTAGKRKSGFGVVLLILGAFLFLGVVFIVLLVVAPLLFVFFSGGGSNIVLDACADVTCNSYCNGNIRYFNGSCVNGQCEYYYQSCSSGCGNGLCKSPTANLSEIYISTSYENKEPYYSTFCDRINPYDLSVREAAAEAIRKHPGAYSTNQLFDIYDWVKANIEYQNVPLEGIPYPASETLATKSGDCKNQAVLIVSMIRAIGGTAKVVADAECKHAYAIVYFGSSETDLSNFSKAVANHYGSNAQVNYLTYNNSIWVIFDPAGGYYPGNTLKNCTGNRTVNMITSCLNCVNQYPNSPYTFNDKCYSQCPSGTITGNQYACKPCQEGYESYNNQCVKCPTGQILGNDGLCYPTCGNPTTYCQSGSHCYNNKCVTCQAGYILGTDGLCYQPCGSPTTYCQSGSYCSNGRCYRS
jgi:RNA polymerase subunit RPABC4/transcription elongation factor Spt4